MSRRRVLFFVIYLSLISVVLCEDDKPNVEAVENPVTKLTENDSDPPNNNDNSETTMEASTLPPCEKDSITTVNGSPVRCAGELIFEELFGGSSIDQNKWQVERRFSTQPDYEFAMYLNNSEVLNVSDGKLLITPIFTTSVYGMDSLRKELDLGNRSARHCTGEVGTRECYHNAKSFDILHPLISGQISTKGKFSFKYGKVEIRAKLPSAEWALPQMFLNPSKGFYGKSNYHSGQMRVAYTLGTRTCELYGGVLLDAEEPFRNVKVCNKLCQKKQNWSLDYHTYTLEWVDNKITVSVDGNEYCDIRPGDGFHELRINGRSLSNVNFLARSTPLAPFDREFYITLGYGVGGHHDFVDEPAVWPGKPWPNLHPKSMEKFLKYVLTKPEWLLNNGTFEVDKIRVYSV